MKKLLTYFVLGCLVFTASAQAQIISKEVTYSALKGLERDPDGFNRRDNSDIIKVGDLYYVWYSKMNQRLGTNDLQYLVRDFARRASLDREGAMLDHR